MNQFLNCVENIDLLGLPEPEFYIDIEYKFNRIMGKTDFLPSSKILLYDTNVLVTT